MKNITLEQLILWTLVGCLALGQLGRATLAPAITIYPHDILIVVWSVYLLFFRRQKSFPQLSTAKTFLQHNTKYWVPFATIAIVSLAISELHAAQLLPLLYLGRIFVYGAFAFLLWSSSTLSHQKVLTGVLGVGLITLVTGLLQYVFIPDTRFLFILGFDDHYYRMIGTQLDPAFMGALFLIALSVVEHLAFLKKHPWVRFSLYLAFLIGIALTFSRASYLGFAVLSIYSFFAIKKPTAQKKLQTIGALIVATTLVVMVALTTTGEGTNIFRTASISARISTFTKTLPASPIEALIGTGLFYSPTRQLTTNTGLTTVPNQARVSDSLFGLLLQGVGILGIIAFVYVFGKIVVHLYRAKQHGVVQLLLVLLVITQFNNTLLQPFVLVTTLLTVTGYLREYR